MNATKAIRTFFEEGEHGSKVDAKELISLKNGITPEEYQELGKLACEALGEPYEPPAE